VSRRVYDKHVVAERTPGGVVGAVVVAVGVWALGWGITSAVRDFSSPREEGIILLGTAVVSVLVALLGVGRALGQRTTRRRAWLTALGVAVLLAGLEFAAWFGLALHELSQLDGS
jgi:hypothetical protein